jgi:hypothetical protein
VGFAGVPATGVAVLSATTVTCIAPAHAAGAVAVAVTTAGGTATRASAFTYAAPAVPKVMAISPASGPTAGGTAVTITGANLDGTLAVTFGVEAATAVTVIDPGTVTCVTPPRDAGNVDLGVTTGSGSATTSAGFAYVPPAPPASGAIGNGANGGGGRCCFGAGIATRTCAQR